jgi:NagD protein
MKIEFKHRALSKIKDDELLIERLQAIKHIALDMDGTLYYDNDPFPWTIPFLNTLENLGISHSFLTNNPTKSAKDYISHLSKMGIKASLDEMLTSARATIDFIKQKFPSYKKLFIIGTPSMISEFEEAGFIAAKGTIDKPDAVIAAFDKTLVYEKLCHAAFWINQGLPYIATNPDRVCPTKERTVLVDCGAICAAIEYAVGRKPNIVIGKPNPIMIETIVKKLNIEPSQIAAAGDRIYTDIRAAENAKALSVLVLSGEAQIKDIEESDLKPDIVVDNLGNLKEMIVFAKNSKKKSSAANA